MASPRKKWLRRKLAEEEAAKQVEQEVIPVPEPAPKPVSKPKPRRLKSKER
tara:strand:- start:628 stop:780 length:153 start_codon:yes stop_codon:yes gene_type:complete